MIGIRMRPELDCGHPMIVKGIYMPGKKRRGTETKTNERVRVERRGPVTIVVLDRPEARNALDGPTADALASAMRDFEADESASVGVLYGGGGNFCAGLDLKALAIDTERSVRYEAEGDAPTGVARMTELSKPLIAAVEGYAVAAGLELAVMCDLRVASRESTFGMFNRRWGVALTDGGTFRLPRLVGQSRALDMILTGRPVRGPEAFEIGLVNRLVGPGETLDAAVRLAGEIARFPQAAVRADRRSVLEQWSLDAEEALKNEWRRGVVTWEDGEIRSGAARFASGKGRHGSFKEI